MNKLPPLSVRERMQAMTFMIDNPPISEVELDVCIRWLAKDAGVKEPEPESMLRALMELKCRRALGP